MLFPCELLGLLLERTREHYLHVCFFNKTKKKRTPDSSSGLVDLPCDHYGLYCLVCCLTTFRSLIYARRSHCSLLRLVWCFALGYLTRFGASG